jgi:D-alanyl-D-alanine carboxypeptidase/D-alanyl-D-alanine-endopeptidase (penicillin-binding protein 4)
MANPRLAAAFAAAVLAAVTGASPVLAASPTPTPTPTPTSSPSISASPMTPTALARISTRVRDALHGSTAKHADYKIVIGIGAISQSPNTASAPASNQKIFTTNALLAKVGSTFRYDTFVSGTATVSSGVLNGDLVLVGSGDPTLTRGDLGGLAHQLYADGLRKVTGRLIVDDSRYSLGTRAPGWKHDFVPDESGAVDAFSVNNDDWKSGAAFLSDPTPANAGLWRDALKAAGIHVAGATDISVAPSAVVPLASHKSRPLSAIVKLTLHQSINYYAEMMLRELGWQYSGHGSRASGIAAVNSFARALSLPLGRVLDGSGLSYRDRETPGNVIAWLTRVQTLATYPAFYNGLAVSCSRSGTLRYRLCGAHLAGKVHAKTGTLDDITSLSGYTRTEGGRDVEFSFLFSGARSVDTANARIDAVIKAVVRSTA